MAKKKASSHSKAGTPVNAPVKAAPKKPYKGKPARKG